MAIKNNSVVVNGSEWVLVSENEIDEIRNTHPGFAHEMDLRNLIGSGLIRKPNSKRHQCFYRHKDQTIEIAKNVFSVSKREN